LSELPHAMVTTAAIAATATWGMRCCVAVPTGRLM
jgi:hypothetical protein